jgi:hypothetical protein
MSSWIVAFVVQSSLVVSGNRKLHMSLGVAVAVLAALLVIVGISTAIASFITTLTATKTSGDLAAS